MALAFGTIGVLTVASKVWAAAATAPKTISTIPASQEIVDEEFKRIIQSNFKRSSPMKATSKTSTKSVAKVAMSAGAKKLLKGGGGVGAFVTFFVFVDSTNAGRGEITQRGAAKSEYQSPRKSNPKWSTKHSHNANDLQIYVRVNTITGSVAKPNLQHGMPGTSSAPAGYIKLSSKNRAKDHGCGKTGVNRWRDSSSHTNSAGWAYFPDCTRNTKYQVTVVDLPPEFKNAKISQTSRTVADAKKRIVIQEFEVNIYNMTDTQTQPEKEKKPTKQKQCVEAQQQANNKPVKGSGASYYGDHYDEYGGNIEYGNSVNDPEPGQPRYKARIKHIFSKDSISSPPDDKQPRECKDLYYSRNITVNVDGALITNKKFKSLNGISVTLSGVKCKSARTAKTNAKGDVVFKNCGRGQINLTFTNLNSSGYYRVHPVPDGIDKNQERGAEVSSNPSSKGQSVLLKVKLQKAYSDSWEKSFRKAARTFWINEQRAGADYPVPGGKVASAAKPVCKKPALYTKNDDIAQASGFIDNKYCQIAYNFHGERLNQYSVACVVYVHEYGHLLGYHHQNDQDSIMHPSIDKDAGATGRLVDKTKCSSQAASNAAKVLPASALAPVIALSKARDKCEADRLMRAFMVKRKSGYLAYSDKNRKNMLDACADGYRYGDYKAKEAKKQGKSYGAVSVTVGGDNPRSCMQYSEKSEPKQRRACDAGEQAAQVARRIKGAKSPKTMRYTTTAKDKAVSECKNINFIDLVPSSQRKDSGKRELALKRLRSACTLGYRDGYSTSRLYEETGNEKYYPYSDRAEGRPKSAAYPCTVKFVTNLQKKGRKPATKQKEACDKGFQNARSYVKNN